MRSAPASAYQHVVEDEQKRRRVLSAWDSGDLSLTEIARQFHVGNPIAWAWVEAAFAAGETTREPHPRSTRASRTGRA